ncbi:DUF6597 domain-containing transcriptional factor [Amycolatopsis kentuckyensis]|uniref:DUF6597 domain-containing transcriptional factor n=1 Tax=Amycolatopsis kentuckyensis TaxID=218823 RepID=UPI00313450A1
MIGVVYEEAAAPPALRGVARCVWRSVSEGPKRIVPDGCVDLVVGDGTAFVAGPDTAAWSSEAEAPLSGVRFLPGRAAAVLGVAADELRDRRVPLGELWGRSLAERLVEGVLTPVAAVTDRLADVPAPDFAVAECRSADPVGSQRHPMRHPAAPAMNRRGPAPCSANPVGSQHHPMPHPAAPATNRRGPAPCSAEPVGSQRHPMPHPAAPAMDRRGPAPCPAAPATSHRHPVPRSAAPAMDRRGPAPCSAEPVRSQHRPVPHPAAPAMDRRAPS